MNAADMLDSALGQLEGPALEKARREVEADPVLSDRLARLGVALELMLDDAGPVASTYDPPRGLGVRAAAFVEQEIRSRSAVLEFTPPRRRLRLEDYAVAATIFLASLLALAPAILRGREGWGRAYCASRLQKVGVRLHQYAALNDEYPFVSPDESVPHVGAMFCRMNEAGFPIAAEDLQCPCSGSECSRHGPLPDLATMKDLMARSPEEARKLLHKDYAMHVGSRRPDGRPGPLPASPTESIPILADRPDFDEGGEILPGNSPNHGGRGQNVLFADGHVSWQSDRWVSPRDSDLYLNNDRRPAYGVDQHDSVLMPTCLHVNAH